MKTGFLHRLPIVTLAAAALMAAAGCASEGLGGGDYTRTQTRGEQTVRMGVSIRCAP